jgi:hypothetical protein
LTRITRITPGRGHVFRPGNRGVLPIASATDRRIGSPNRPACRRMPTRPERR